MGYPSVCLVVSTSVPSSDQVHREFCIKWKVNISAAWLIPSFEHLFLRGIGLCHYLLWSTCPLHAIKTLFCIRKALLPSSFVYTILLLIISPCFWLIFQLVCLRGWKLDRCSNSINTTVVSDTKYTKEQLQQMFFKNIAFFAI